VGDYNADRIVNLGKGHGALDNGFGYTYFNAATGLEFSAVSGLTYNFRSPHTDYQNGIDWHTDLEASRGITMRTIFRHFPTREELLSTFWKWQLEQTGGQTILGPASLESLLETIKEFFESLDSEENLIRAVISSPEGREIRKEANRIRLEKMLEFVKTIVPELSKRERHSMASGIVSVSSILSWLFMRDNCGYDGKRAGEAAALNVQLIIEAGQARAALLCEA